MKNSGVSVSLPVPIPAGWMRHNYCWMCPQRRVQRHPTPEAPLIKNFINPSHILFFILQTVCWGLASVLGVRAMSQGSIVLLTLAFAMQIVFLLIAQYTVLSHINPGVGNWVEITGMDMTLLAMIALSAVQSSARTFIHNAILFIDISDNAWYNQVHWLLGTPYLSKITSNELLNFAQCFCF